MSRPRFDWWGYVKGMIRRYPRLKEEYAEMKRMSLPSSAAAPEEGRRRSGVGDPVAAVVFRELSPVKQREYEAVAAAVNVTRRLWDGRDRLRLIEIVFWRRTHTLQGAAIVLSVSYSTAVRWHRDFIRLVAERYGLLD